MTEVEPKAAISAAAPVEFATAGPHWLPPIGSSSVTTTTPFGEPKLIAATVSS